MRLDLLHFLFRQQQLRLFPQPFLRQLFGQPLEGLFDTVEMRGKNPVESVELGLILDEARTRQVVEILDALPGHALLHGLEQGQELGDGRLHAAFPEHEEEPGQHVGLL